MKRFLRVVLGIGASLSAAAIVSFFLVLPPLVEKEAVNAARQRGVELSPGELTFGLTSVHLKKSKFSLIGVPSLHATAGDIEVELQAFQPRRFAVSDLELEAVGDPRAVAEELLSWSRSHAQSFEEAVLAKPVAFALRPRAGEDAWVRLRDGALEARAERVTLTAASSMVAGRALGALDLSASRNGVSAGLTLGMSSPLNPALTLEFKDQSTGSIHLGLSPVPLTKLAEIAGTKLELPAATLSGTLDVEVPDANPLASSKGHADFTLRGFTPPHPIELDGLVFGDETGVTTRFELEPERARIRLDETRLTCGDLALAGAGEVKLADGRPRLTLALDGVLPCAALAASAAESRLGRALGRLSGAAARATLDGGVGVHLNVDADLLDPAHARVEKTLTPGCGLKALGVSQLTALGQLIPHALDPAVANDLARLLNAELPALTKTAPALTRTPTAASSARK